MRYQTLGDWYDQKVESTTFDDSRSEAGILVHELIEYIICMYNGISQDQVDKDDAMVLKKKMKPNQVCYWKAHLAALKVEMLLVESLGLPWSDHEDNAAHRWREFKKLYKKDKKHG